jgi:hypothetical protein
LLVLIPSNECISTILNDIGQDSELTEEDQKRLKTALAVSGSVSHWLEGAEILILHGNLCQLLDRWNQLSNETKAKILAFVESGSSPQ